MDNWDDIKVAYIVGQEGTVAAASEKLDVHRATVIRHIDALEDKLGEKIFVREKTGYTPTPAGEQLFRVAQITEEQFEEVSHHIKGQSAYIRGELIITSLDVLAPLILPSIAEFHKKYKQTKTVFVSTEQVLTLDYGETHIALRPGPRPEIMNTVVIEYGLLKFGLFASGKYIEKHGIPKNISDFKNHYFVSHNRPPKTPTHKWEKENMPFNRIALTAATPAVLHEGILNGVGIGFVDSFVSNKHPHLVEVFPPEENWHVPLWLIIHQDMYKTEKIQAFLKILDSSNPLRG